MSAMQHKYVHMNLTNSMNYPVCEFYCNSNKKTRQCLSTHVSLIWC
jgi:hypothetical protein